MARLVGAEPALGPWRMIDVPQALDLRDPEAAALVKEAAPDAVIHLAAELGPGCPRPLSRCRLMSSARSICFRCGGSASAGAWCSLARATYGRVPDSELPIRRPSARPAKPGAQ